MNLIFFNRQKQVRIIWRIALFVVITFAINIPLQLLLQSILEEGLIRGYLSASCFFGSMLTSLLIQTRVVMRTSLSYYGLAIDSGWLPEFGFGCIVAAMQLLVFFVVVTATGNARLDQFLVTRSDEFSFFGGLFSELFAQLVGSAGEEVFFRGFMFFLALEALKRLNLTPNMRVSITCIITSLLFGLAHATNEGATVLTTINLTIDGIMLACAVVVTGRLGMAIGLHFAWNVIQGAVLGLGNSGNVAKVSVMTLEMKDNLITGGGFGPEGSILIILLDALAILLMFSWKKYNSTVAGLVHARIQ